MAETKAQTKRDCLSIYFKDRALIDRLKRLSKTTGQSVSSIVDSVISASMPMLEKHAPKTREFDLSCRVRI